MILQHTRYNASLGERRNRINNRSADQAPCTMCSCAMHEYIIPVQVCKTLHRCCIIRESRKVFRWRNTGGTSSTDSVLTVFQEYALRVLRVLDNISASAQRTLPKLAVFWGLILRILPALGVFVDSIPWNMPLYLRCFGILCCSCIEYSCSQYFGFWYY